MKIAIFGAQGKFGSQLSARLKAIKPEGIEVLETVDKKHNPEIAKECDLAILAVKPHDTEELIKEIQPFLKEQAQVLSFAAYYPFHSMSRYSGKNVGRMMADPWWGISAYLLEPEFNTSGLEFLFSDLSTLSPKRLSSDSEMDTFTFLISYLFVVLLLHRTGEMSNIDTHLKYLSEQLEINQADLLSIAPNDGDPIELLATTSTKGGLTEKIITIVRNNSDTPPEEILRSFL